MMDHWDEVRTAYQVARVGTVSGAAEVLGVHHATVIRHIDALEARLGAKLFQRHPRGYTPTEAGQDLMRVAQATEDQFSQLQGRLKGQGEGVDGELVVTSLTTLSDLMVPALAEFQAAHPGLVVRYLTGDRLYRLEYGEAHVAIRAGSAPDQPDNVVQPFLSQKIGLYAAQGYVERHGLPAGPDDYADHIFVGNDNSDNRAPFIAWMRDKVPAEAIVFRCNQGVTMQQAVLDGAGIGFLSARQAAKADGITCVLPPQEKWTAKFWLVTHVDLHRTHKVQTFLRFLKEKAKDWSE